MITARRYIIRLVFCTLCALWTLPAQSVQPDEVLAEPALEARARALSLELRCPVCQNQSIDDSNAELARDLRLLIRERLVAGDNDAEVVNYLVDRYGTYILLKPRFEMATLLLWLAPALILGTAAVGFSVLWRRKETAPVELQPLSDNDKAVLARALQQEEII